MRFAIIEDGVVTNIIWLYPGNAADYPNAVAMDDLPVVIGDEYAEGVFTRSGIQVRTPLEEAQGTINEQDAALVDLYYEKALLELGITEG